MKRHKYNVYKRFFDMSDEDYDSGMDGLVKWVGATLAVSESQAVNNVKFRINGHGGELAKEIICTHHTAAIPIYVAAIQYSPQDKRLYEMAKRN